MRDKDGNEMLRVFRLAHFYKSEIVAASTKVEASSFFYAIPEYVAYLNSTGIDSAIKSINGVHATGKPRVI